VEGNLPGRRPDAEFVAVRVGELRPFAPGFSTQLFGKIDTTSLERFTGFFYIVGMQDVASEARFVAATLAAQAKHDMGLCSGWSYFEPALGFAHGLVIDLLKAERVDIEVEGFVLVADTYTDGAYFREHRYLLFVDHSIFNNNSSRTKFQVYVDAKIPSAERGLRGTSNLEITLESPTKKGCAIAGWSPTRCPWQGVRR
jgi:hypothetical protein